MKIRTYTELMRFPTLRERYEYLKIGGEVGRSTFGFDRYLNQLFYKSAAWRQTRDQVIVRDDGCDLGIPGEVIGGKLLVHHMNPITAEQIENEDPVMFDPEFLICCSERTHNAIHFGDARQLPGVIIERKPGDTCPWK